MMNDFERAAIKLDGVEAEIKAALSQAARAGAKIFVEGAKRRAPVRTGFLRSGIGMRRLSRGKYRVFSEAFYSKFVEYGTSKMSARPFMRPTLDEDGDKITAAIEEVLLRHSRAAMKK